MPGDKTGTEQKREYTTYTYGNLRTRAGNIPGNGKIFDIGSISKVMTGL